MTRRLTWQIALLAGIAFLAVVMSVSPWSTTVPRPADRQGVVFWHFWGGADRVTVDDVVRRYNASQDEYFVSAIAMPGTNLDVKLFLALAGGSPPDVVNQDDPIIADWASRGAIVPLSELADAEELEMLGKWLYPAARKLGLNNYQTLSNKMEKYGIE
jgi:multiple sugar transport system substrate-binding protein